MALGALRVFGLAERFLPVVAHPAVFVLPVHLLGHEVFLLLHRENLGVAVGAFGLVGGHMRFMAEDDRVRALGSKLDIPPARLFLLSVSHAERNEADEGNRDDEGLPHSPFQIPPPRFRIGQRQESSYPKLVYPQQENPVKRKKIKLQTTDFRPRTHGGPTTGSSVDVQCLRSGV